MNGPSVDAGTPLRALGFRDSTRPCPDPERGGEHTSPTSLGAGPVDVPFGTGLINFGTLVPEEPENFVRFGSNDGLERFLAIKLPDGRRYARLVVAPTLVHVWSVQNTIHPTIGGRSDPPAFALAPPPGGAGAPPAPLRARDPYGSGRCRSEGVSL